ncbi:hypothetical protein BU26DRAFT_572859 [Trematosphaeria pertusa]|uniref:Uncharacterized protein n=1 Tax=Trematosphaeria pertusa TaxID=390896 RepID=A0A6A6HRX5_9PLEO|nr:uncharacterized protein BU26DRAFT_572859 [Trematosphaeria pertusa]KAF2240293.1 hypothetical protein BU26DRAFT_572859 [Trematosphaeria pertusa]
MNQAASNLIAATASKANERVPFTPTETDAALASRSPFRFLDLPKNIRRIAYDYIFAQCLRCVMGPEFGLWFEDVRPCIPLLQVSKTVNDEASAGMHINRFLHPVTLIITMDRGAIDCLEMVLNMLCLGHNYDLWHQRNAKAQKRPSEGLDKFTLKLPTSDFKKRVRQYYRAQDYGWPQWSDKYDVQLDDFYRFAMFQLRRQPVIEIRLLIGDGNDCEHLVYDRRHARHCVEEPYHLLEDLKRKVVIVSANAEIEAHAKGKEELREEAEGLVDGITWELASSAMELKLLKKRKKKSGKR